MNAELQRANRKDRIRRVIRAKPGINGTALARATDNLNALARNEILDELIAAGEISLEIKRGGPGTKGGRPLKCYRWRSEAQH